MSHYKVLYKSTDTLLLYIILQWKWSWFSGALIEIGWRFCWWAVLIKTRMWANAQRDGRPAEHRWCPLFNAAKFGWRPLLDCRAVMLPSRDTRWNMMGCPKSANQSQPLVGLCSPYCKDIWRRCCLTNFFPIVDTCVSCEDIAWRSCAMVLRWWFLWSPYVIGQTIIFLPCYFYLLSIFFFFLA